MPVLWLGSQGMRTSDSTIMQGLSLASMNTTSVHWTQINAALVISDAAALHPECLSLFIEAISEDRAK